jgi:hypothetical protein
VLAGGNLSVVVWVGDTVHRSAGPWTPTVHQLLATLRATGVTEVPEPFGLDEQGREVLCHLPGTVGNYPILSWMRSPTILHEAGSLLRRVHDADAPLANLPYLAYRLVPLGEQEGDRVQEEDARPGRLDVLIRS